MLNRRPRIGSPTAWRRNNLAGFILAASWSLSLGHCHGSALSAQIEPHSTKPAPIVVVTHPANPFSRYLTEILRAEGFNEFDERDIASLTQAIVDQYDVVVLGEIPLTAEQAALIGEWVARGGNLIAMRPDKRLAELLGLTDRSTTLSNAYMRVETSSPPGTGIVDETIQFHGTADCYTLAGARAVATLYADAATATSCPAVTLCEVGTHGGQAAAFSYDLARSIVFTRQGNPAWAGQKRDAQLGTIAREDIRSDDLFYGAASFDLQPDWIDPQKIAIPQADEQQRLLGNLILHLNRNRRPLPRFWYLPRGNKAVVVMTGDDHGRGGTAGRFDQYRRLSPDGCSVADWECVRSSSFVYASTPLSERQAAAYTNDGFELGIHISTHTEFGTCQGANWTPSSLPRFYADQLGDWSLKYAHLPPPSSNRVHCVAWTDYVTQAKVELSHGIRLDLNYYYFPAGWVQDRPGFFTGSGLPMRFADVDGTIIDVYQAPTQMTDESGQSYPFTVNTLLDRALGREGYYGALVANIHTDHAQSAESDAIVTAAQRRGVPIVSGRQMLQWLDARNGSVFHAIEWCDDGLNFTITTAPGASGLRGLLPITSARGTLAGIRRSEAPVPYMTETIKGITYAAFNAVDGRYLAIYEGSPSTRH